MSVSINDIKKAIRITQNNKYRIVNSYNHPGGLVDISMLDLPTIIIGDLHGSIENLNAIMNDDNNIEKIKNNEIYLIILGDGMHNDQTGEMLEMATSLEVLERLIELICELKDNIIYIKGNHDSFDERITKSGIRQGYEFKKFLIENKGDEFLEIVDEFFESLPQFVIGSGFVVTHAGPTRRGATRKELIDIEDNEDYISQLMWNRVHEFRGNPSMKEYGSDDIRKMLLKLNLPEDTYFIVGHNPLWKTGNKTGIWHDVTGIKNHIIIISNKQTNGPYLLITNGEVKDKFAVSEEKGSYYGW
ncbi:MULTISPECIES: metallophosphoesterase [unclassified Oceanispirochaeta]|uniref:metallophosphoesterase n=1 Tax=unclassified Oceanispirochaeta TaxID=2635722 RepID=UPI000E0964AD|nr:MULTISPECIES: metallophosphoesterase [unclassified Oceanispirochaeta]MBF9018995.1 metallophosphoesterase [Oceanispirochaeta sp. M2]NPD75495.1 metallophosphoesterase [Oceanispirochaeta sp. M1]RDG28652.1 metallophosphoesterase [Oceanispirochaeta sp. M1]